MSREAISHRGVLLFGPDDQQNIRGLLRFEACNGQGFNVDWLRLVFSTDPIASVEEMLAEEKAWDALTITTICKGGDGYIPELMTKEDEHGIKLLDQSLSELKI